MRKLTLLKKRLQKEDVQDRALTKAKTDLKEFLLECSLSPKDVKSRGDGTYNSLDEFLEEQHRHAEDS